MTMRDGREIYMDGAREVDGALLATSPEFVSIESEVELHPLSVPRVSVVEWPHCSYCGEDLEDDYLDYDEDELVCSRACWDDLSLMDFYGGAGDW
jgi:formylmethanofuran dehydrogenase subunit E